MVSYFALKKRRAWYDAINTVLRYSFNLLVILIFCFCVAFDAHEIMPFNLTYLLGAMVALIVAIVIGYYIHKRGKKLNELISITQINIIASLVFYGFVFLILALIGTLFLNSVFSLISDWVPLLIISLALIVVGITYRKEIKQMFKNEVWLIYYFLAWAIIHIFLFVFFLQRSFLGTFSTFQILLAIILCIDAIVVLAFNSDMENIFEVLSSNKNLVIASNSKVFTSNIKLILGNITAIVTLFKSIFDKEDAIDSFINFMSNVFKNFNDITHIIPTELDVDCNFKMIIFMFISIVVIFLMSWLSLEFEKKIYVLVHFTKKTSK